MTASANTRPTKYCPCCFLGNRVEVKVCFCGYSFSPPPSHKMMRKAMSKVRTDTGIDQRVNP